MTEKLEDRELRDVFEKLGGRAGYALMLRQCGFKAYSALLANWEKANAISPVWRPGVIAVAERFGKSIPLTKQIESFIRPLSRTWAKESQQDFSANPLYARIKALHGSVDKFILHMKLEHGKALQRNEVYTWFRQGWVSRKVKGTMFQEGFSREVLGNNPAEAATIPLHTVKKPEHELSAEDLF